MSSLLLHLDAGSLKTSLHGWCREAAELIARLKVHGVSSVVLLQCPSSVEAATALDYLRAADDSSNCSVLLQQPSETDVAFRLALDKIGVPSSQLVVISISSTPHAADIAVAAGCHTLRLPPEALPAHLQPEALQAVAALAARRAGALLVGYLMKPSRQLALAAQGMLPLLPVDGLAFAPLDAGRSLAQQQQCHIVLQKLTDCLAPSGSGAVASFGPEAAALTAYLQQHPEVLLVDPLERLQLILDREALAPVLERTAQAVRRHGIPMRAPAWVLLPDAGVNGSAGDSAAAVAQLLEAAGVQFPAIVKPQVACGVSEAHQMALVLSAAGLEELSVPLPAVAQEYVDHGGRVWKIYVAGEQVFVHQRKSTPNLGPLARQLSAAAADGAATPSIPTSITFDSLHSLPTSLPWTAPAAVVAAGEEVGGGQPAEPWLLQQPAVERVAAVLQEQLQLTLFGFDLVLDAAAGELVIIDVNYFPSFKGVPEAPAALRAALTARYSAR